MIRRIPAIAIAAILFSCTRQPAEQSEVVRPNIVFIMSDDHAQRAISAYTPELIHTPNIDRLAKEGVLFANSFVTNSICAPSRAVMLTGKFSHLNGKTDNLDHFDGTQQTFPKLLQQAGYSTAVIGKLHLKTVPEGFDYSKLLVAQGDYYSPQIISEGDTSRVEGYATEIITDYVLDYLENRDKEKPFCVLYHHKAPHRNWMPNVADLDTATFKNIPIPDSYFDEYEGRPAAEAADMRINDMFLSYDLKLFPEYYGEETGTGGEKGLDAMKFWQKKYDLMTPEQRAAWDAYYQPINEAFERANLQGKDLAKWKYQRYMEDYLRCIKSVDDNIGRVLDYLDEHDLAENTIVVYTSDQGFYLGEHGWYDKRFMYEESMRTPLLVRYPKEIKAGGKASQMVQNIDYAPTFLDFAGVEIPADMQGESFRPIVTNPEQAKGRDALYYHFYEYPQGSHFVKRHYGVRTDRYKLIHFYNDIDKWELYDLKEDPHEMHNIYDDSEYVDIQSDLHERLSELRSKYKDNTPES